MKNKVRSVKFNFIMNSILTASAMIFPIVTYPYVSRILQPSGIGTVSFGKLCDHILFRCLHSWGFYVWNPGMRKGARRQGKVIKDSTGDSFD